MAEGYIWSCPDAFHIHSHIVEAPYRRTQSCYKVGTVFPHNPPSPPRVKTPAHMTVRDIDEEDRS